MRSIGIKHGGGVVIKAARAAFKDRCDDHNLVLTGDGGEGFSGWARQRLSQIKKRGVFTLAEILCAEKLRQADHLRALLGGSSELFPRPGEDCRQGQASSTSESDQR